MAKKKNVVVLVDEQLGQSLESVTAAVEAGGVRIERVMHRMKTIVGVVADKSVIERVRRIEGVASIREEEEYALPPMNRDVPQ